MLVFMEGEERMGFCRYEYLGKCYGYPHPKLAFDCDFNCQTSGADRQEETGKS
ncbi:hypothetical protein LINPERPRIM_LOCUS26577 [Linum perenne]